jgi:outer membrane protein OmpA-like peptidoglycan-associated protein
VRALALVFCLLLLPVVVHAKDAAGAKDHSLVGRYQGSEISFYATNDFDEAWLLKAPVDYAAISAKSVSEHGGSEWLKLQGRITQIRYDGPAGRSSLEILANLQAGLAAKGLTTLFDCSDEACFAGTMRDSYLLGWQLDGAQQNSRYATHARYTLASLDRPEGKVYVAMLVGEGVPGPTVFLRIVELKPMDAGKVVFVDADAMQKSLAASGRVALYGIFFDTNRDTLKPDSKPTLEQIARLLKSNPGLKIIVTGHTDNQGAFDYNVDLSRRRAAAVVTALAADYGIAKDRLTPFGAGMAAPATTNSTDEGRAKNRRVELVEK